MNGYAYYRRVTELHPNNFVNFSFELNNFVIHLMEYT